MKQKIFYQVTLNVFKWNKKNLLWVYLEGLFFQFLLLPVFADCRRQRKLPAKRHVYSQVQQNENIPEYTAQERGQNIEIAVMPIPNNYEIEALDPNQYNFKVSEF